MLDQRYLSGDRSLYAKLVEKLPRFITGNRDALIRNLSQLTRERHSKYADTFYHLEPNVKETPGGLASCPIPGAHCRPIGRSGTLG